MAEYLEREKVFFALEELRMMETMSKHATYESYAIARDAMERMQIVVAGLPTADVAPVVHGRWIEDHDYLKCPECGVMVKWDFTFFDIGNWNYCPNCGAMMDGGTDDAADGNV